MKRTLFLMIYLAGALTCFAQTLNQEICRKYHPSTLVDLYEIISRTPLSADKQNQLAQSIEAVNQQTAEILSQQGFLNNNQRNTLHKMFDLHLRKILSAEELMSYYRGMCDAEAEKSATEIKAIVDRQLKLGYQEAKFIFATFYKIELDTRAAKMMYADQPKKVAAETARINQEQREILKNKCHIEVDNQYQAKRL